MYTCITAGPSLIPLRPLRLLAADTVQPDYLSCDQTVMQRNMHVTDMTHQQPTNLPVCIVQLAWQASSIPYRLAVEFLT